MWINMGRRCPGKFPFTLCPSGDVVAAFLVVISKTPSAALVIIFYFLIAKG